jgi:two-component system, OmpR family, alkaline phosphatase synthesis response regulator PhoP
VEQQHSAVGPKILVVEDDRSTARLLEFLLSREGYEVTRAKDGVRAIQVALEFAPDVILLDLYLPDMTGAEVLKRLRAEPGGGNPAVIILSARSFELPPQQLAELGASATCTKPIAPSSLLRVLKEVLAATRTEVAS